MPQAWNTLFCTDPSNNYCWFCHQVPKYIVHVFPEMITAKMIQIHSHIIWVFQKMGGFPPPSSGRTTACLFPSDQRVSEMGRSASDEVKGRELIYMGVSKNRGTPKPSILIRFSIVNHPFWGTTIFGNTHMVTYLWYMSHMISVYTPESIIGWMLTKNMEVPNNHPILGFNMFFLTGHWGCIIKLKLT